MRPLRLEVQGFGPYAGTESVDFADLATDGLFLIHGPTGAGKSALLDAMCFALYGQIPGSRTASGLRSHHAAPDLATEVRFEFAADGDHWLVRRRPGYDRPKHRGDGVTKEHPQAHLFKREGAEWKPVAKATNEVNRELTDLLGLTHEQFARVIVLPQGQFQRVLRPTNAREREELLTSLFDTELFGSIESWVQDRWRSAAADVADGQRTLEHLRSQAHDRHRELSFDDARATDVDLSHAETPHDDVGAELAVDPSASQITDQDGFDRVAESARRRAAGATDLVATTRAQLDRALATHASVAAATERWDRRAQLLAASQQLSSTAETAAGWAARLDAARGQPLHCARRSTQPSMPLLRWPTLRLPKTLRPRRFAAPFGAVRSPSICPSSVPSTATSTPRRHTHPSAPAQVRIPTASSPPPSPAPPRRSSKEPTRTRRCSLAARS